MSTLSSVSKRTKTIYQLYYEDRERQRFENLYTIFDTIAAHVDAADLGAKLDIDYFCLAEVIRSYFLDAIRYKEYHFDPKTSKASSLVRTKLAQNGFQSLDQVDPFSPLWTELVHTTVNINASKVAAYTVKWILRHKPIRVLSTLPELTAFTGENADLTFRQPIWFLTCINEYYALQCALVALGIEAVNIDPKKIEEVIYCFKFRPFDESSYFMILSEDYFSAAQG